MTTLEKVKHAMIDDLVSISDKTRQHVYQAKDVEECIEILAREYPQMAQAIAFLRVLEILKV